MCSLLDLHGGDKFLYIPYLITPIFLIEHLNVGVPPDPLIQYLQFTMAPPKNLKIK
jgi:hypothetical protein